MPARPSARLLVVDPLGCVLLFHFVFRRGALAGTHWWATPGGRLEEGESFAEAAIRELREETGLVVPSVGAQVARREFHMRTVKGDPIAFDEHYFRIDVRDRVLSRDGWTELEREILAEHRWWSQAELAATAETIHPEGLLDLLRATRNSATV